MDIKCFVPVCKNSSKNCKKIFISVPLANETRIKWFKAVGKAMSSSKSVYCCEDHFNLEEDAENWNLFKLDSIHLQMKKEVVPHKYIKEQCHIPQTSSILSDSEKKRKYDMDLNFKDTFQQEQSSDSQSCTSDIPRKKLRVEEKVRRQAARDSTSSKKSSKNHLVNMQTFFSSLQLLANHNEEKGCNFSNINMYSEDSDGLNTKINLVCNNCKEIFEIPLLENTTDLNLTITSEALGAGIGLTETNAFLEAIGVSTLKPAHFEKVTKIMSPEEVFIKEERIDFVDDVEDEFVDEVVL